MNPGFFIAAYVAAILSALIGAIALWRDPRPLVNRLFVVGMVVLALNQLGLGLAAQAPTLERQLQWQWVSYLAAAELPACWIAFAMSYGNLRIGPAAWQKGIPLVVGLLPAPFVALFPNAFFDLSDVIAGEPLTLLPLGWSGKWLLFVLLVLSVLVLATLEAALRAAQGTRRWQIKFVVLGIASFFAIRIYLYSESLLYSAVDYSAQIVQPYGVIVGDLMLLIGLSRRRRLESDLYLSRTVLLNSITVLVAGCYLVAVGLLAELAGRFGGSDSLPLAVFSLFLGMLALTVALTSDRLREQVKGFINTNFYRHAYDYRREWTRFTARTASAVDRRELCAAVSRYVSEVFGVASVSIWLRGEPVEDAHLGGSTLLSPDDLRERIDMRAAAAHLIARVEHERSVVDLAASAPGPDLEEFLNETQARYAVPLSVADHRIGLVTLSERITHQPLSLEDRTLLRTVADQAAASLLQLELSGRLLHAREAEAFQTLSAFFAHDLKNLAARLSLTMQNVPRNFDNPDFRRDALRTLRDTVDKMDKMCGQLSLMTRNLEIHLHETDLGQLVSSTVAELNGTLRRPPVLEIGPPHEVAIDAEQMRKVLTNLLLNAHDATEAGGEIRVSAGADRDWAILTVTDTGCGMPAEFIEHSLFRPFQTTKSRGIGIGLYQSRRIVEAHRGRIEVESREGIGTTFRVLLPLTP